MRQRPFLLPLINRTLHSLGIYRTQRLIALRATLQFKLAIAHLLLLLDLSERELRREQGIFRCIISYPIKRRNVMTQTVTRLRVTDSRRTFASLILR
jgi:hypothetical protein